MKGLGGKAKGTVILHQTKDGKVTKETKKGERKANGYSNWYVAKLLRDCPS